MKTVFRKWPALLAFSGGVFLGGVAILSPTMAASAPKPPAACATRTFSVYFEQWKSDLGPEARDALAAEQQSFKGCSVDHVKIVGLAGAKGAPDDNQELSSQRAETVAGFLTAGGWPRDRLELVALGDKGATRNDVDRPIRRRVRVTVQSQPSQ